MTFRLVGLMSLVLLLSLASFALLMNSYQADVMGEVTRTVSAVGRATLQTFERRVDSGEPMKVPLPPAAGGGEGKGYSYQMVTQVLHPDPEGTRQGVVVLRIHSPLHEECIDDGKAGAHGDCLVMVKSEDVHAESGPAGDTVLKIPTFRFEEKGAKAGDGPADSMIWVADGSGDPMNDRDEIKEAGLAATCQTKIAGSEGRRTTVTCMQGVASEAKLTEAAKPGNETITKSAGHEIVLPIPTREFRDLFADFRKRILFLFLGVFVLGTLLSAGLAMRFTRPVRRLDAAIRRLAEGDLEARVEVNGSDEVGRLGRAFNDMAGRLRSGREREAEMRRREKLSALGRMAAGVAHDVRNPLHSIGLTLQNLQETARPVEPGRSQEFDRSIAVIREEIRRLDRLIENFLRFARSDRGLKVSVDLARLARETAQLVEREAERRGVRVLVSGDEAPAIVEGDREAIRSSILNLVLNSFEAMPEGGTLTLSVRRLEGEARLEVADTGRGIPEQEQEKVFEFAYTTREDGHGLGLAMVHQVVVEDHGGSVSLSSRPGEGTRVLLAFPSAPPLPAGAAS